MIASARADPICGSASSCSFVAVLMSMIADCDVLPVVTAGAVAGAVVIGFGGLSAGADEAGGALGAEVDGDGVWAWARTGAASISANAASAVVLNVRIETLLPVGGRPWNAFPDEPGMNLQSRIE